MKNLLFIFCFVFFLSHTCAEAMETSAEAACLMLAETGEIIYEKNGYERLPMASTTKIITALVALEKSSPDSIVTVSANAESQEGSSIYLKRGDKITMEDLLYGLMLNSGNDAAVAVAEHISGNVDAFSEEMTRLSKKTGAENSSFKNPSGLYDKKHLTTAHDLAVITAYALENPVFAEIVSTTRKTVTINGSEQIYLKNHNKLLNMYDGVIGVKTGYTKKCGRCLVSAAERNGIRLIAVTLNAPDDWNDHIAMYDYGFSGCKNITLLQKGEAFKTAVAKGNKTVGCTVAENISVCTFGGTPPRAKIITHLSSSLCAPIHCGEKIGEAELVINGKTIKRFDILSDREILQSRTSRFFITLLRVLKMWKNFYLQ